MNSESDVKALDNTVDTRAEKLPTPSNSVWQEIKEIISAIRSNDDTSHQFLLRVVQPGLAGLMDGSVSTLAPIFATAFFTHRSFAAFLELVWLSQRPFPMMESLRAVVIQ